MNGDASTEHAAWPLDIASHRVDAGLRGIVQGVGSVRASLGAEVDLQGVRRPLIVCGAQVRRSRAFAIVHDTVRDAIGDAPLVYDGSRPHSPSNAIDECAAFARANGVDGIVAVGGSSSIDSAKGIATLVATGIERVAALTPPPPGGLSAPAERTVAHARFPVLTVTTTLSYAEFFPFWGTRLADIGAKRGFGDHGAVSRTIFLDGELAACTPDTVWFETAVKSFDDALFSYLRSLGPEPYLDPLLVAGMRGVVDLLAASATPPGGEADAAARQRVLTAMALTKYPAPRIGRSLGTEWFARAVRYALGALYELPHGVGTCIAMRAGLRFHRDIPHDRLVSLADALGFGPTAGERSAIDAMVAGLDTFLAPLGLARGLDDLGLTDEQIDAVVDDIRAAMPALGPRAEIDAAVRGLRAPARPVSSRP